MEKIIPISDLLSHAKKYVDQVQRTDQPVIVTQRGRAAAVLVSCGAYEGFVATQAETAYLDWRKRLARAEKEIKEGKGKTLETYLRKRKSRS